jgi:putative transposase
MANTYTQIHIQLVFAVRYKAALIEKPWSNQLHKYITGIVRENDHNMLQVNSMPDHIHIFIGMHPDQGISALAQQVKTETTKWIRAKAYCNLPFEWQEGFGAFSYSRSHVQDVIRYIQNQETNHKKEKFLDEYRRILNAFEIPYDEQRVFKGLE